MGEVRELIKWSRPVLGMYAIALSLTAAILVVGGILKPNNLFVVERGVLIPTLGLYALWITAALCAVSAVVKVVLERKVTQRAIVWGTGTGFGVILTLAVGPQQLEVWMMNFSIFCTIGWTLSWCIKGVIG